MMSCHSFVWLAVATCEFTGFHKEMSNSQCVNLPVKISDFS